MCLLLTSKEAGAFLLQQRAVPSWRGSPLKMLTVDTALVRLQQATLEEL